MPNMKLENGNSSAIPCRDNLLNTAPETGAAGAGQPDVLWTASAEPVPTLRRTGPGTQRGGGRLAVRRPSPGDGHLLPLIGRRAEMAHRRAAVPEWCRGAGGSGLPRALRATPCCLAMLAGVRLLEPSGAIWGEAARGREQLAAEGCYLSSGNRSPCPLPPRHSTWPVSTPLLLTRWAPWGRINELTSSRGSPCQTLHKQPPKL